MKKKVYLAIFATTMVASMMVTAAFAAAPEKAAEARGNWSLSFYGSNVGQSMGSITYKNATITVWYTT